MIAKKFNNIKKVDIYENYGIIEEYIAISTHFNRAHIGINILSKSKEIMNDMMVLSENIGCRPLYQDTDRTFVLKKDLPKIHLAFEEKYGKNLLGNGLGEFSSDFEIKDCKNVVCNSAIFVGKKKYWCGLSGENKEGEIVKSPKIRMNGITNGSIHLKAELDYEGETKNIYQDLYDGNKVEFDLSIGGNKALFEFSETSIMFRKNNIYRTIQL